MDLFRSTRVQVVSFAAYTRQIFQLLDLALFGIFKSEGKYPLPFGDLGTTVTFRYNVYMKMPKILTGPSKHMGRILGDWNAVVSNTGSIPYRVVLSFTRKS
jgi:hypothetical protein